MKIALVSDLRKPREILTKKPGNRKSTPKKEKGKRKKEEVELN